MSEVEEVKNEIENAGGTSVELGIPDRTCIGVRFAGCTQDVLGYLSDDKDGNRWILQNPAEIHYKPEEGKPGVFKIVFVPASPASDGVLFIPYGHVQYVFSPKADIKLEYETKFEHTPNSDTKRIPKYEG